MRRLSAARAAAAALRPLGNSSLLERFHRLRALSAKQKRKDEKQDEDEDPGHASHTSGHPSGHTSGLDDLPFDLPLHRCGRPPSSLPLPRLPFRFDTGVGLFAKRTPRPFPPPFYSPPSASFSDALSTHHLSRDGSRHAVVGGRLIGGCTNGDDAVYASEYFIAANDGVGAWSMRPRGHAGLWARLVIHFWADAVYEDICAAAEAAEAAEAAAAETVVGPAATAADPAKYLQRAYEQTLEATRPPNDWQGTTTATGAQLSFSATDPHVYEPLLHVTNLGDSQVMVVRPAESRLVFKTSEQWHWFDCPRQLGTNSPDTPRANAVIDAVPIRVGDIVLAMSDGVIDNLWTHEIVHRVCSSVAAWQKKSGDNESTPSSHDSHDSHDSHGSPRHHAMMMHVAEELVEAARVIAVDPFAESPFMEHAIDEGLPSEGGKLDDISVVAALCCSNDD